MNTIFTTDDPSEYIDKINLDELFEKKKAHDLQTTNHYKTVLNRIHSKIKLTSRQNLSEQFCWFVIPEMMIGVPKYDVAKCISFCMDKLTDNGFNVRYTHPNLLLITWNHWVPSYVRNEIKKKTGVNIDGYGNIQNNEDKSDIDLNPNNLFKIKDLSKDSNKFNEKDSKSITSYKPSGKLVYNNNLLDLLKNNL